MKRDMLEFCLENNDYMEGGTKEACVKVREFLKHSIPQDNRLSSYHSCVSAEEFKEAVETLLAFTFRQADTIPERWKCDNDCKMTSSLLCPGECNIDKDSDNVCPHFIDEGNI